MIINSIELWRTNMTAIDNTPENKNFLSPLNFRFSIKRAPHVNFFLQRVNIPSLELPEIMIPTQFVPIPTEFTHLKYGQFSITFKVDEDLQNYLEIHNWMRALGFPTDYKEYADIAKIPEYTGEGTRSDISLIALNSAKNPNYEIVFVDAFPISLGDIVFDTTDNDVNYVTTTANFIYTYYNINKIA
jgi:hypothetical protein